MFPRLSQAGLSFSSARSAKGMPSTWRLWVVALVVALLGRLNPYLLPVAGSLAVFALWGAVARHAVAFPRTDADMHYPRKGRGLAFSAGLFALAAYLVAGVLLVDYLLLGWEDGRLVGSILAASVVAFSVAYAMIAQRWRIGKMLAMFAVLGTFGGLALIEVNHPFAARPAVDAIGTPFVRLALVIGAAQALTLMGSRWRAMRFSNPKWIGQVGAKTLQTIGMLLALAVISQPAEVTSAPDVRWLAMTSLMGGAVVYVLARARFAVRKDLRWLGRLTRSGWRGAGPIPLEIFVTIAMAPAIAVAPLATWANWALPFVLGVLASLAAAAGTRRRSGTVNARARSKGDQRPLVASLFAA